MVRIVKADFQITEPQPTGQNREAPRALTADEMEFVSGARKKKKGGGGCGGCCGMACCCCVQN